MAKRVIGLDIGSYSIKVLHLENSEVVKTHEVPYSEEALLALKNSEWLEGDVLVTGLSGAGAQVRSLDVPFMNPKKIGAILGSLLDAQLPLEIDDLTLSWFLQTTKQDTQQRILAAFAKRSSIRDFLASLERVGVNPNILTLKAAGLYELLRHQLTEQKLAAIVDMGGQSTSICIGDDQRMIMARSVMKADSTSAIREIRQTFIALERPIAQVYLVGGGALKAGIEQEFSKILEIPVQVLKPFALSPVMALAASYALIGQTPNEKINRFNLRKDEFSFRSDIQLMTDRSLTFGIWALILIVLLSINYGTRRYFLGSRIEGLQQSEQSLCDQVMGKKAGNCLSAMKKAIAQDKQDAIPKVSAVDLYLEVSKWLPKDVKVKVTDLAIEPDGVRLSGDTADFESVDLLVAGLAKGPCFKNVEKGQARQAQSGVNFQISMDVGCGGGK